MIQITDRKNSSKLIRAGSDEKSNNNNNNNQNNKKINHNEKRSPYSKNNAGFPINTNNNIINKEKEKRININATKIEKTNTHINNATNLKNLVPSFSNSAGMFKSESSTNSIAVTKTNFNSSGGNLKTSLTKKPKI